LIISSPYLILFPLSEWVTSLYIRPHRHEWLWRHIYSQCRCLPVFLQQAGVPTWRWHVQPFVQKFQLVVGRPQWLSPELLLHTRQVTG
jgi:hypothetical protein